MPTAACTPVDGTPTVLETGDRARTEVRVDAMEKVFPGHYPGFPIYPGVCVVECVHRSALATLPGRGEGWRLSAVEATRFLSPVFPGDDLSIDLAWSRKEDERRCKAVVSSSRGDVARVRLRFRNGRQQ